MVGGRWVDGLGRIGVEDSTETLQKSFVAYDTILLDLFRVTVVARYNTCPAGYYFNWLEQDSDSIGRNCLAFVGPQRYTAVNRV